MKSFKELWVNKKTNEPRIIDGYGKYIALDKKILQDLINTHKDEFYHTRINGVTFSFGYDNDFNSYTVSGHGTESFKKFKTFEEFWDYFSKNIYRKK